MADFPNNGAARPIYGSSISCPTLLNKDFEARTNWDFDTGWSSKSGCARSLSTTFTI